MHGIVAIHSGHQVVPKAINSLLAILTSYHRTNLKNVITYRITRQTMSLNISNMRHLPGKGGGQITGKTLGMLNLP